MAQVSIVFIDDEKGNWWKKEEEKAIYVRPSVLLSWDSTRMNASFL